MRTAFRICPLCEATCGLELTVKDDQIVRGPRRPGPRVQHRASSARRARRSGSWCTTPTGCAGRCVRGGDGDAPRGGWDEAFAGRRRRAAPRPRPRHGRDAVAVLPRQPQRAHDGRAALRRPAAQGPRQPQRLLRQHRRPDAEARGVRLPVRRPRRDPGARPRPDRPAGAPRREPAGSPTAACARRPTSPGGCSALQARGGRFVVDRPAADPHRRRGRRAPVHPARHATRSCCSGSCTRCSTRAWSRWRRSPGTSRGVEQVAGLAKDFAPEVVAAALRRAGRDGPPARPGPGRRAHRRRLRPHRHLHGRVRHPHQLAGRRRQRPDRQPRPARRRDVRPRRARVRRHPPADGVPRRPVDQPGPRAAGGRGRAPGRRRSPTRSRRPATGQVRALVTFAGNPVLSTPTAAGSRAALADARVHGERRPVPQRDDPARAT